MFDLTELVLGVLAVMAAWIAKLKYAANKKEVEDVLAGSEVSHRAEKIKDFEAINKEEYDELVEYIDSADLDKF